MLQALRTVSMIGLGWAGAAAALAPPAAATSSGSSSGSRS